jgi:hypothetical protein
MATRMQQRRGTEAQWLSANPVLAAGEIGFETDTNQFKIGDGVNVWTDISYFQTIGDLGGTFDDYVPLSAKGNPDGVATLDQNAQVPLSQLQNLIDNAPETLDTLNDIATAINVIDGEIDTKISTAVGLESDAREQAISQAISEEEDSRDAAIDQAIDNEVIARDAAISAAIGQEVSDRNTAISSDIATAIADLALDADAQAYASTAEQNAKDYADSEIDDHVAVSTNVHGIADTSALATKTYSDSAVSTHNSDTTNVHGIADTSVLATDSDIQDAKDYADTQIDAHVAVTTNVHGIADTTKVVLKDAASTVLDGNLTVDGDLTVNGTNFAASATSITIEDNMLQLAHENAANTVDLGLVVAYNDGTAKHSGIVRDVSANSWKLFKGVTTEPTTTVDFTQGSLDDLAVNNVTVAGVVFTDGTQSKQGVPSLTPIIAKTDSYTLSSLTERDSLVEVSKSTATTITIPADSAVNYPVGTSIDILQTSTGQVTIAGAAGVTVNATPGLKLRTQWSSATLFKRSANTWVVYGDLSA